MKKIEFPDHVYQNLLNFLARVDLKGSEVVAFNEITKCLANFIKEESNLKQE